MKNRINGVKEEGSDNTKTFPGFKNFTILVVMWLKATIFFCVCLFFFVNKIISRHKRRAQEVKCINV